MMTERAMILNDRDLMLKLLAKLWVKNTRYARAVYLRNQYGLTFKEIAEELGVSVEYARQMEIRGMNIMRKWIKYGKV